MGGTRVLLEGPHFHKEPKSIYMFLTRFGKNLAFGSPRNEKSHLPKRLKHRGVDLCVSPVPSKKLRIIYPSGKHRDFGATGYSDYTLHKCKARRARYRKRHRKDRIHDPFKPGALSWWILWGNSTSLETNFRAFVKKFYTKIMKN